MPLIGARTGESVVPTLTYTWPAPGLFGFCLAARACHVVRSSAEPFYSWEAGKGEGMDEAGGRGWGVLEWYGDS